MIDAHVHVWDPADGCAWLGPEHGILNRPYTAGEAGAALAGAGVVRGILVQADDTAADTETMLAAGRANRWVAGVVGWVPLDDDGAAPAALETLAADPLAVGLRHLTHNDPRDFLRLPAVRRSLRRAAGLGLAFDVPDAWPRTLGATVELARELPALTVVLDHLGKPPLGAGTGSEEFTSWRREFDALAELPNTVAKVSGLHLPGVPYTPEALRPLWDAALESFGPERLMLGGDWPVSLLGGDYTATICLVRGFAAELSSHERGEVESGCAVRAYGLGQMSWTHTP